MAVTLKDIAEQTGVSPSVVSTVLSGRDNGTFVSESTRRKVIQVAEMLNYTPVRSGRPRGSRRLRRQREEHFIGVWDSEFSVASAHYVRSLQSALRHHAMQSGADAEDDYGIRLLAPEDLPRLDALGVMGLIVLSPAPLPREAAIATIPCVMIGEIDNPPRELAMVHMDEFNGSRHLADYLHGLGHRRIVFIAPGAYPRTTRMRYQGMQSSWILHNLDPKQVLPAQYDALKDLSERDQIRQTVLGLFGPEAPVENAPTALVCFDEQVAQVASQVLAEVGRSIPESMSLAAFHDTPRVADSMHPALTTVRAPIDEIARLVIQQLYRMHELDSLEDLPDRDTQVPGQLVIRNSCAPPPSEE